MADAAQAKRRNVRNEMSVAGIQQSLKKPALEIFANFCNFCSLGRLLHLDVIRLTGYIPLSQVRPGHIKALCSLSALKANLFAGCFENAPFHAIGTREH